MKTRSGSEESLRCSFCHKSQDAVAKLISSLGSQIERLLAKYREGVMDRQYQLARIADSATEIYVCCCVLVLVPPIGMASLS